MANSIVKKVLEWIDRKRFVLLLLSTVITLVLPAFSGSGLLSEFIFVTAMSFLFLQSMVVAEVEKSRKNILKLVVITLILISWLKPLGIHSVYLEVFKFSFFVAFFVFVITYLIRFISRADKVDLNVMITSINIYLLAGIIGASLAMVCYKIFPDAYTIPAYMNPTEFNTFVYYSFVTLSTVGYGDISPRIPETQTLAYIISVAGQMYVAIIIALLIGKYLMHSNSEK